MAVTILSPHPENYTRYILPKREGIEERDVRAYPLPPRANFAVLNAVMEELREQGHYVQHTPKRERLVDWSATHRHNERSFCADEGWRPNPKGPQLLRFVAGGWDIVVQVDQRFTRLMPEHLRMGRQMLRIVLAGRP